MRRFAAHVLKRREKQYVLVQLPRTMVPGCEDRLVVGRSSAVVNLTHLVVPKSIAPWFEVLEFHVGKNSRFHFQGNGGVSAECFAGDVEAYSVDRDSPADFLKKVNLDVPLPIRFDVATPDLDISVRVRNLDVCARSFHCVLYGTLVE